MKEPFLINPPKRARTRKDRIGREGTLHRPRVYVRKGRWKTSSKARVAKPSWFVNPIGETLVTVGGNPMQYFHRRKNPVGTGLKGAMNVKSWAPLALVGGASAITAGILPPMIPFVNTLGPWGQIGARLGVAFLGGMVVNRVSNQEYAKVWTVVGVSLVAYDLLRQYVMPMVSGFIPGAPAAVSGFEYQGYTEEGNSQVNAYPNAVGSYPDQGGVQAYPLGEIASYPYDGQYGSYYTRT